MHIDLKNHNSAKDSMLVVLIFDCLTSVPSHCFYDHKLPAFMVDPANTDLFEGFL